MTRDNPSFGATAFDHWTVDVLPLPQQPPAGYNSNRYPTPGSFRM